MQVQHLVQGGFGDVMNLISAKGEYKRSQEEGDNAAISVAKGLGAFAWGEFYYGGVARALNEGPFGFIGKTASTLGSIAGAGVGSVAGAGIGSLVKHPLKGAALGGGVGRLVGGFAGNMGAFMLATAVPQMAAQLPLFWENTGKTMSSAYKQRGKLGSGYFEMTQAGYTMRQRSLNAIRQNGLNTQSVLGNEARTCFRSWGLDD